MYFHCPHCRQSLDAEPDMVGTFLPCPACGQAIRVPFPSQRVQIARPREIRLVQRPRVPPPPPRKGSLAERVATLKAAQHRADSEQTTLDPGPGTEPTNGSYL